MSGPRMGARRLPRSLRQAGRAASRHHRSTPMGHWAPPRAPYGGDVSPSPPLPTPRRSHVCAGAFAARRGRRSLPCGPHLTQAVIKPLGRGTRRAPPATDYYTVAQAVPPETIKLLDPDKDYYKRYYWLSAWDSARAIIVLIVTA